MVEATTELAVKKAEYQLMEEELQRAKLSQLEYEQKGHWKLIIVNLKCLKLVNN